MTFELSGTITDIFPVETYSNFRKRRFWLQQPDKEKYPQHWQIEVHTNQLALLDAVHPGDVVICTVNLLGRQLRNKANEKVIINTLQCWKLNKQEQEIKKKIKSAAAISDDDDLPF